MVETTVKNLLVDPYTICHGEKANPSRFQGSDSHDCIAISATWDGDLHIDPKCEKSTNPIVIEQFAEAYGQYGESVLRTQPLASGKCPYCKNGVVFREQREDDFELAGDSEVLVTLEICEHCNYWRWHYMSSFAPRGYYIIGYKSAVSKRGTFNEKLPRGCSIEMTKALRRKPSIFHTVNTKRFERFVADVFRANYRHAEVIHVGQPCDGGKDVVLIEAGEEAWLISVKRRQSSSATEGVETIRNLLGVLAIEGTRRGIVVSSADHFSYWAYDSIGRAAEQGFVIDVVDRGKLNRMMSALLPAFPWHASLRESYPEASRLFSRDLPCPNQMSLNLEFGVDF